MIELLAELRFEGGGGAACLLAGWGPAEPQHRWTIGAESRLRLPVVRPGPGCVLLIDALPWTNADCMPAQTIMLAVNGRLLTTLRLSDHRALAFPLPDSVADAAELVLEIHHLNSRTQRPSAGLSHGGEPLGLLVTSVRIFRLPPWGGPPVTHAAFPGSLADSTLQACVQAATGLPAEALVMRFESIGQNCEFGLVQRGFGAEPLGLLRFASLVTHALVDGLMASFAGVGRPETTRIYLTDPPEREYRMHEQTYYLWYGTGQTEAQATQDAVLAQQCRRLGYLQPKFAADLHTGDKTYVLTFTDPGPLTDSEALAVFCALNRHGANRLLYTVFGDPARAGQVDRLYPGLLRGHLGAVDARLYGSWDAWLSLLAHAAREAGEAKKAVLF